MLLVANDFIPHFFTFNYHMYDRMHAGWEGHIRATLQQITKFMVCLKDGYTAKYCTEMQDIATAVKGLGLSWFSFRSKNSELIHRRGVGTTGDQCHTIGRLLKVLQVWTTMEQEHGFGVNETNNNEDESGDEVRAALTEAEIKVAWQHFKSMKALHVANYCEARGADIHRINGNGKQVNMYANALRILALDLFKAHTNIIKVVASPKEAAQLAVAMHNAFVVMNKPLHLLGDPHVKCVMQKVCEAFWKFDDFTATSNQTNIVIRRSILLCSLMLPRQCDYVGSVAHLLDDQGEFNIQAMKREGKKTHGKGGPEAAARRVNLFESIKRLGVDENSLTRLELDVMNAEAGVADMLDDLAAAGRSMVDYEQQARAERRSTKKEVYAYNNESQVKIALSEDRALSVWQCGPEVYVQRQIDLKCCKLSLNDIKEQAGLVFVTVSLGDDDDDLRWVGKGVDWSPAILISFEFVGSSKKWCSIGKDYKEWVVAQGQLGWGFYYLNSDA